MDIFDFRGRLIEDYADYTRSVLAVRERRLRGFVEDQLAAGVLWPEPLIQLNPSFEPGGRPAAETSGSLHRIRARPSSPRIRCRGDLYLIRQRR